MTKLLRLCSTLFVVAWVGCGLPGDLDCREPSDCAEGEACVVSISEAHELFGEPGADEPLCATTSGGRCTSPASTPPSFCAVGDHTSFYGLQAVAERGEAFSVIDNRL